MNWYYLQAYLLIVITCFRSYLSIYAHNLSIYLSIYPQNLSIYLTVYNLSIYLSWVNRVSIPATGRYCLATLMSSDRTKQICLWMTIYIYIYILPYPRWVKFSGEEVIVLPLAIIASLFVWIEVSATVERMYVNNINCDS